MAFSREFDPANGFVALPSDIMEIEMSPGAFRLLVELCRMANLSGECWPSLAQLSDRIGRSKAAISGYIAELREIDLLQTLNQKMANGYNYRLKYCVTFWEKWRAQLSLAGRKMRVQKDECSVQPSERRVNSKNHTHKTHSRQNTGKPLTDESGLLESVFSKWTDLSKASAFPHFNGSVPNELVKETKALMQIEVPKNLTPNEVNSKLKRLWEELRVDVTQADLFAQRDLLIARKFTAAGFEQFELTIKELWQNHWRKPPTTQQFASVVEQSGDKNREEGILRMLEQYLKRWEISQNKLHHLTHSHSLKSKQAA